LTVRDALAQLDERSRLLLVLVAVEGLSYAEAAEVVDLPVGTVKSRVSRARVRLGELLAEPQDGDDDHARSRPVPRPAGENPDDTASIRGPPG
jgi:RNA polymerase sigma-70 factor, ECF subfamily